MSDQDDKMNPSGRPSACWVRIEAAAEWLGLGVRFLRRLVAEKRIPYSKVGKYLLFDLNKLDDWVRSQHIDPLR
ncbi:MAG: excisionase family DNA binding protein [Ilumatobacter sp.]|jgi:excisionase family DNA binding protein